MSGVVRQSAQRGRGKGSGLRGPAVAEPHLPGEAELRRIAERILRFSDADETEVEVDAGVDALTRFANNTIHQNVAEQTLFVSVRTVFDGRTARASTNKTDDESLRRVVAVSAALAKSQPKNPDLLAMPGKQKYAAVKRYFPATAGATPAERARAVATVVKNAEKIGQTAAGVFTTGAFAMLLANSRGLYATHRQTRAEFSVTMMEGDSSGWVKGNSPDIRGIDPSAMAAIASEKCAASRHPREVEPGRWTVILEPSAVQDLVGFLAYDFAGTSILDQRSCFNERVGKKVAGENITLCDDVSHPLQTGAPFDGEGMPRQKVALIERGVAKNLVYARATAKKMKAKPSGHGFSLPNEYGEAPVNLVIKGGQTSVPEMVAATERGILLTRLWYIREVDPYEKVLT